ncbi:unnamed protein product [Nippostrongylus brasiliensis]|uniref:Secreted protein n=1 Tax=Nippostrongylus brasiliensis TaxID=27835 RepID=A0A0N4Y9N1_NIPBR|nr:unnamed protein product [Nippostrongylus brasiliensis]
MSPARIFHCVTHLSFSQRDGHSHQSSHTDRYHKQHRLFTAEHSICSHEEFRSTKKSTSTKNGDEDAV